MSKARIASIALMAACAAFSINAHGDDAPAVPAVGTGVAAGSAPVAAGLSTGTLVIGGAVAAAAVVATGIALAGTSNGNGNNPTTTGPTQTRP